MMKITTHSDVWQVTFLVTSAITSFLTLVIMALYPRSEWLWELALLWTMTIPISALTVSQISKQVLKVHQLNSELSRLVARDRLTDVSTRDHFFDCLVQDPGAYGVSLMVDIDFFKRVNDTYGHLTGDKVITHVARVLQRETRPNDLVCRFGGEEFVIFLMNASLSKGTEIAERLRQQIEAQPIDDEGSMIGVTVSIGGSLKDAAEEIDDAIKRADEALYRAKSLGRNCTVFSPNAENFAQV